MDNKPILPIPMFGLGGPRITTAQCRNIVGCFFCSIYPTCKTSHHCAHAPQRIEMPITHLLSATFMSRSLSLKTLTPPSTILRPGLLIPIPMMGLTIPTIHTKKSPLIQNQNTSRGHKTRGHRYIRHVTPTAARQASKSISVNAYEMGYTGKPRTTLC